jgi:hypothetical protein
MRYSQIRWEALRVALKMSKNLKALGMKSIDEFLMRFKREAAIDYVKSKNPLQFADSYLLSTIIKGDYTNYFIETKELFDFLCMAEVRDPKGFEVVISREATFHEKYHDGLAIDTKTRSGLADATGTEAFNFYGVIHAPVIERSIMFLAMRSIGKDGREQSHIFVSNGDDISMCPLDDLDFKGNLEKERNLVINLFFYMDCFPNSIKAGAPNICIQPYVIANNSKSLHITTHESLIDHSGVTPHFRRGHFRHLVSEQFTKKRGQTIFIRSTFVKGHAETVEDVGPGRVEMLNS